MNGMPFDHPASLSGDDSDLPRIVSWKASPARQRPGLAIAVLGVLCAFGALVGLLAGDWIWGAVAAVILFATVSRFFLPTTIVLSSEGIRAEFPLLTRRVQWEQIEWIRHDRIGALIRLRRRRLLRSPEFTILFGLDPDHALAGLTALAPSGLVAPARKTIEAGT